MIEKLLSALLHAKSGALAALLVIGTSGALVAAAVDNGMTTFTNNQGETTEPSTNQSNTTTNTVSEAILALFSNRQNAEDDPTSTATGPGCSDEAHERNDAMKDVNDAFKENHQAVLDVSKDAPKSADTRALVKEADKELKDIRQEAVKEIHGTFDCDKDDEDEDPTSTATTNTTATLTGRTAEEIAEEAIEAMEKVVTDLEAALESPEESDEESEEATTTNTKQNGKPDSDKSEKGNKGGNGKGRGR